MFDDETLAARDTSVAAADDPVFAAEAAWRAARSRYDAAIAAAVNRGVVMAAEEALGDAETIFCNTAATTPAGLFRQVVYLRDHLERHSEALGAAAAADTAAQLDIAQLARDLRRLSKLIADDRARGVDDNVALVDLVETMIDGAEPAAADPDAMVLHLFREWQRRNRIIDTFHSDDALTAEGEHISAIERVIYETPCRTAAGRAIKVFLLAANSDLGVARGGALASPVDDGEGGRGGYDIYGNLRLDTHALRSLLRDAIGDLPELAELVQAWLSVPLVWPEAEAGADDPDRAEANRATSTSC